MRCLPAFAFLVLAAVFSTAAGAACETGDLPDVEVTARIPEPALNHDLSTEQIPQAMRAHKPRDGLAAIRQVGATAFTMNSERRISVAALPGRGDCFRLNRLEIELEVLRLDVYIASELSPGSCPYRVTLEHEHRHVAIYRAGVQRLRTEIETALTRAGLPPAIPARNIQQAISRYMTAIDTVLSDARRKNSEEMARANALLDTPSGYRREHAKCPAREW